MKHKLVDVCAQALGGSTGHTMHAEISQDPHAKKSSQGSTSECLWAKTKGVCPLARNSLPSVTQRVQIAVVCRTIVQNCVVADCDEIVERLR